MLTRSDVIQAFRFLLGREPESEDAIMHHMRHQSLAEFRNVIFKSNEFTTLLSLAERNLQDVDAWVIKQVDSGLRFWINLNDDGVSAGCLRGYWEAEETEFLLSYLAPGDTFIDVGSNIGWYAIHAAKIIGQTGVVYAFEPRSDIHNYLCQTVRENGFSDICKVHKSALGSASGVRKLSWYPYERNPGHSFFDGSAEDLPNAVSEDVHVMALDNFEINSRVTAIKIDVEGSELEVLRGARLLLRRDQPLILMELYPASLRQVSNVSVSDLFTYLEDIEYVPFRFNREGVGSQLRFVEDEVGSEHFYCNIVLLPKTRLPAFRKTQLDGRVRELEQRISILTGAAL